MTLPQFSFFSLGHARKIPLIKLFLAQTQNGEYDIKDTTIRRRKTVICEKEKR